MTTEQTIQKAAEQHGCTAEIVQETAIKWCRTWQTPMNHVRTSQGWVCTCGELAPPSEEKDILLSRPYPY